MSVVCILVICDVFLMICGCMSRDVGGYSVMYSRDLKCILVMYSRDLVVYSRDLLCYSRDV